jgi:hypothetical protein
MREPVAIAAAIRGLILAAVAFGLNWTAEQVAALMFAVEAVLALVVRQSVTPNATATEAIQKTADTGVVQPLKALLIVVLGGSLLVSACNRLPANTSPEANLGIRATQVVEGLRAAPPILKTITCTTLEQQKAERRTCVTPNEADFVAAQIQTAFERAEELGRVLQVYDTARDASEQASLMAKAAIAAKAIQQAIGLAQIRPQFEEARQSVLQLFARVSELLLAFTPPTPAPA